MLINCPECALQLSDKAMNCPHCGYPMKQRQNIKQNRISRLPNGFGQITELKNRNLRKPFRVMVTIGKTETGRPICKILKPNGYFKTYKDAYEALLEYNKDPYTLDSIITLEELYNRWSEKHFQKYKSESSIKVIKAAWKLLLPFSQDTVRNIKNKRLKEYIEAINTTPAMLKRVKSLLSMMFDYAVEYEYTDKNYVKQISIDINDSTEKEHIIYTDEEMKILWSHSDDEMVQNIIIQCYSGWRPGELCTLKIENINLEEGFFTGGMKTENGINRPVPIHSKILPFIQAKYQLAKTKGLEYLITIDGKNTDYKHFNYSYEKKIVELGLNPDHRPHDGRKHFVTMAKQAGVNEYAIKYIVGHSIKDLTESVYTERKPEWFKSEIEKIK